jgi:hypothetical protein
VSLWRTDDAKASNTGTAGPTWKIVKHPIAGEAKISALALVPGHSDQLWVGYDNGALFRSTNAAATNPAWKRITGTDVPPGGGARFCTCITIDPRHPKTVYVTYGGYSTGNVWVTRDDGVTWNDLAATLPPAPVRSIAVHPRRSEALYLGTELGMFASENSGASWSPANEGPTNCSVEDLFWMGEVLICATYGRGMFRIDLSGL